MHEQAEELDLVSKGRDANGKLKPGSLLEGRLVVRKGVEAHLAVVGTHAGVPDAAEAHIDYCSAFATPFHATLLQCSALR